ncbi:iron-sulfur cluster biosynthesis family protein [Lactobacillus rossiae]|uniref:Iron-sulfur cluster biosynthesis family protein n=2 Tax=Furfurilactobacillus milii TaxID=2888272 RepID=A0A6N9I1G5_9LACO|nr:iron-sulfur cluster biosynthesis family protein [Furfurilactobacillus milii]
MEALKMAEEHELTFDDEVVAQLKPLLIDGNQLLLSYDDGVGPYSHHGLVALQVSFQLVVVGKDANVDDYQALIPSNLGPVRYKDYSGRFLGKQLHATFNRLMHAIKLSDEGEQIDDNVEVIVDASASQPAQSN